MNTISKNKNRIAFVAALLTSAILAGVVPASAWFVSHAAACQKVGGSGVAVTNANGVLNSSTTAGSSISVLCPFDESQGLYGQDTLEAVIHDGSDASGDEGSVIVSACYATRFAVGAACAGTAKSPDTATGYYTLRIMKNSYNATFRSSTGYQAAKYLSVKLPANTAGGVLSHVRSFGGGTTSVIVLPPG